MPANCEYTYQTDVNLKAWELISTRKQICPVYFLGLLCDLPEKLTIGISIINKCFSCSFFFMSRLFLHLYILYLDAKKWKRKQLLGNVKIGAQRHVIKMRVQRAYTRTRRLNPRPGTVYLLRRVKSARGMYKEWQSKGNWDAMIDYIRLMFLFGTRYKYRFHSAPRT